MKRKQQEPKEEEENDGVGELQVTKQQKPEEKETKEEVQKEETLAKEDLLREKLQYSYRPATVSSRLEQQRFLSAFLGQPPFSKALVLPSF